ncbi:MAG: response regulator [Stenomitos rutilans HA7619-LM2]|jgi:signal transduction histidine kinase|nr:response regulator [Stenomitos rutilans HA7619-LM2]
MSAKILVVEDEPVIALDIQRQLTQLGYTVVAIADCATLALEAVERWHPDLALMDIRLRGDQNGIETAALIRQHHEVPIVFLTAHADAATMQQVKAVYPYGYIVKPFEKHDLMTAIEVALNRYQAELVTQAALAKEKELNKLKSDFIAIVSHEFRNPLSAILLSLDLLQRHHSQLTFAKAQSLLQRARLAADRIKHLLQEVLTTATAEAGKLQCEPSPIDLVAFCHQLIAEFQLDHDLKNTPQTTIVLTHTKEPDERNSLIDLDENLLHHILTNLLSNAIKYSPHGGKVQFRVHHTLDAAIFQVQDCGIGIPERDLPHLFERFHRASNAKAIPGTGLGLAIVKQCVDLHGGTIDVQSILGVGTTFTVTIPITQNEDCLPSA